MTTSNLLRTPLFDSHVALGARIVDFAGWAMPVQYASILDEHRAVRSASGMFDVSHMGRVIVAGADALSFLQWTIASDVRKLEPERGLYSVICNDDGGIRDDVILYQLAADRYYLVCNAANRSAVLVALAQYQANFTDAAFQDVTATTGMIALQGPEAAHQLAGLGDDGPHLAAEMTPFACAQATLAGESALVARTGYTGEDGFEIMAPADAIRTLWTRLVEQGVKPCGLGARDTLRLEAALPLHGHDIGPDTDPIAAGLGWVVSLDKGPFVGYDKIARVKTDGPARRLVCFVVTGRGIPRAGYALVKDGQAVGETTSGSVGPTVQKNIGMGYVPAKLAATGTVRDVDLRGTLTPVRIVRRPFYRRTNRQPAS